MSTVLKFRRGDTTAANAFTGQEGELFVDTTKDTLVVHDGVTAGGVPLATESYVTTQISNLIDAAPTTLNTLNELAAALNDDANFASTVTTLLAGKQDAFNQSLNTTDSARLVQLNVGTSGGLETIIYNDGITINGNFVVTENNLKTINGNSILGSGDITISGGGFSGDYNDLINTPTSFTNLTLNSETHITGWIKDGLGNVYSGGSNSFLTTDGNSVIWQSIKTINGQSLLGSGDIVITGGISSESDPVYAGSSWYTTTNNSSNWDTSYGWGNHATVGYATETYVGTQLSSKQNTLVSGSNIKTINGQSLLGAGNITISGGSGGSSLTYGQFVDNTVALTTTAADQVIDTFSAVDYRSSKYIIQAVCDQVGIHSTEVMIIHDGSTVYITEYAALFTNGSLFTVDASIVGDPAQVVVTVTPTNANTTFDVVRTSLAARTFTAPSLEGDLMLLSGSEDLQTETGSVDLNA